MKKVFTIILMALMFTPHIKAQFPIVTSVDTICQSWLNNNEVYYSARWNGNNIVVWNHDLSSRTDFTIDVPQGNEIISYGYVYKNVYSTDGKFGCIVTFKDASNNYKVQVINEDSEVLFEKENTSTAFVVKDHLITYTDVENQGKYTYIYKLPGKLLPYGEHTKTSDTSAPQAMANQVSIYPNPVTQQLNISPSNHSIDIYNIQGNFIEQLPPRTTTINVSDYNKGQYIIKTGETTLKFIKE